MKVTVLVETDEARVLGIGFKGSHEFNFGYEVELPIAELVAYKKAKDAWHGVQERLDMIYRAKMKRHHKVLRRIEKKYRRKIENAGKSSFESRS